MDRKSQNYAFRTFRFDQLWLPFSLLLLFMIVGFITRTDDKLYDLTRIFLSTVLPLVTGILAAYTLLDDPALELTFSTPVNLSWLLIRRLLIILVVQMVLAGLMEVYAVLFKVSLADFGNFWQLQLVWLIPCLACLAFGCFVALAGASPMAGAITIGLVWFLQAILHSWFASNQVARYFFLFMGGLNPGNESLLWNRLSLAAFAVLFFLGSLQLLRHQERYL